MNERPKLSECVTIDDERDMLIFHGIAITRQLLEAAIAVSPSGAWFRNDRVRNGVTGETVMTCSVRTGWDARPGQFE